jgi:hypothetical protein
MESIVGHCDEPQTSGGGYRISGATRGVAEPFCGPVLLCVRPALSFDHGTNSLKTRLRKNSVWRHFELGRGLFSRSRHVGCEVPCHEISGMVRMKRSTMVYVAPRLRVYKEASMRLGRPKVALILTDDERMRLDSLAHRSRTAPHLARRARIILACAEGHDN